MLLLVLFVVVDCVVDVVLDVVVDVVVDVVDVGIVVEVRSMFWCCFVDVVLMLF